MSYLEFEEKYSQFSIDRFIVQSTDPKLGGNESAQVVDEGVRENITIPFTGIVNSLITDFFDGENVLPEKTKKIRVISDEDIFLHLPWEEMFDNTLPILKQVKHKKENNIRRNTNSIKKILILTSSARDVNGCSVVANLTEDIKSETSEVLDLKNEIHDFNEERRLEYIYIVKNFNISSQVNDIPVCDILHIICHGKKDGSICISVAGRPNEMHVVATDKFIKIIEERSFHLIYLSCCHSGSGSKLQNSLAYELVHNGISKYCISFQRSVNSRKSIRVAKRFYVSLFRQKFNVEEAYQSLFEDSTLNAELKELMPILYC